jgi:hypothetical protein
MTAICDMNGLLWTVDDLNKKWANTFIEAEFPKADKFLKAVIRLRDFGNASVNISLWENGKVVPHTISHKALQVVEDRPSPCITNLNDTEAMMFTYNPERQWRRGLCSDNAFFFFQPGVRPSPYPMDSFPTIELAFHPQHANLEESLNTFQKKNSKVRTRAISNRYWLFRKDGEDSVRLYRRQAFMGSFIGKKFFVSNAAKIFNEEINMELPVLRTKYSYA